MRVHALQPTARARDVSPPSGVTDQAGEEPLAKPWLLDELDRLGYAGFVTVHQASAGLGGAEEAARRSARFLQQIGPFEDRKART